MTKTYWALKHKFWDMLYTGGNSVPVLFNRSSRASTYLSKYDLHDLLVPVKVEIVEAKK